MKPSERIFIIITCMTITLAIIPAFMSYSMDKTFQLYVPAVKHIYGGGAFDCKGNLASWVRYNLLLMQYAYVTQLKFDDKVEIEKILSDSSYRIHAEAENNTFVNEILNRKLEYQDDVAPFFCHPRVNEIHKMMLKLNDYNLFFYAALFSGHRDKTMIRFNNIKVVLGNVLAEIQNDPELNTMLNEAVKN